MTTRKFFKTIVAKHLLLPTLALAIVMVITAACNLPGDEPEESVEPVDPDAQMYRMYFDSSVDPDESELQIRQFSGQLRLADIEGIFGDIDDLAQDDNGNIVGGPVLEDGLVWSLVMSPSQMGVNLMTRDLDGTISSALDLDGDQIADIVDIRLPDGRRISFVTELLGMGVFEAWLLGRNPLCNTDLGQDLGFEIWGCGEDEEGSGEGSGGGGGASVGNGYVDPFDLICSEYDTSRPGFSRQVMGLYPGERIRYENVTQTIYGEGAEVGDATEQTWVVENEAGQHIYTMKIIRHFDNNTEFFFEVIETVSPSGNGTRILSKLLPNGSWTVSSPQRFEARLFDNGDYDANASNPPVPVPDEPPPSDTSEGPSGGDPPPEPPPEVPDDSNPGPEGDNSAIADMCERRENATSGVEQAAATDPTAFQVSCDDLVGAPASGDDCMIIDWAGSRDFSEALHPSDDDGCDDFEEPGQGGDCEPANVMEILRGRTAMLASIKLNVVDICPAIVCNPGEVVEAEGARPLSGEAPEGGFATVTPTPEPSSIGAIPDLALCYWGPGAAWGTVSSLAAGIEVEIVGIGALEGWLIVENPNFEGVTCWVAEEDVEIGPSLDISLLPEFEIPALVNGDAGDEGGGALAGPSNLKATTAFGNPCKVTLNWKDNSDNESGFRIYRDGILIGTVGANVTTFTDNNATETDGYNYRVRAYNAEGESGAVATDSDTCFG